MKKKKILIVDLGGVMGGVEYYVETLSGMLRERATLVSLCVLPELAQHLRSLGVKVFLIPAFPRLRALRFLLAFGLLPIIILREKMCIRDSVSPMRVISGPPSLQAEAMNTVRLWRYKPFARDGEPLDVTTDVRVEFDPAKPGGVVTHPNH